MGKRIGFLALISFFIGSCLFAKTFDIAARIDGLKIYKVYEVTAGPSEIKLKRTKRLTMRCFRLVGVPENFKEKDIKKGTIDISVLNSAVITFPNMWPATATTQLNSGPDGRYIHFKTRQYQEGIINEKTK